MAQALIVDDSRFMRRIIKSALEEGGHNIIGEADNGADGIALFKELKPDFVTMDITMGGKDGIRAVQEIHDFDKDARIIVVSALNENTIKQNEPQIKATAFITKPFEKEKLLKAIEGILEK